MLKFIAVEVTGSYAIESYDFDRKKIALVYPETGSRQVQDYGKGLLYMITGGQCYTNPWPYSMPRCIPDSYVTIFGFTNITEGIRDPSVFDIPSPPCPRDMDNAVEPLLFGHVQP
uniref:Uncharacterized protein n=1 Tax=Branchiostoma floridae TaxID=7739 RepID=C3Y791_BRAFL|eukprot:XP_002607709.1 hypothetical protein BRAFLDRAFT_82844 [Branchiostoma floridae]